MVLELPSSSRMPTWDFSRERERKFYLSEACLQVSVTVPHLPLRANPPICLQWRRVLTYSAFPPATAQKRPAAMRQALGMSPKILHASPQDW